MKPRREGTPLWVLGVLVIVAVTTTLYGFDQYLTAECGAVTTNAFLTGTYAYVPWVLGVAQTGAVIFLGRWTRRPAANIASGAALPLCSPVASG